MTNYRKQIAKGVALLDEKVPGWLERIDVDRLDMVNGASASRSAPCGCVLAQTDDVRTFGYGSYFDHVNRLGVFDGRRASSLGFRTSRSWKRLTDEWKAAIVRLRAERSS